MHPEGLDESMRAKEATAKTRGQRIAAKIIRESLIEVEGEPWHRVRVETIYDKIAEMIDAPPATDAAKEIAEIEKRVTFYNDSDTAAMSMADFTRLIAIARAAIAQSRDARREQAEKDAKIADWHAGVESSGSQTRSTALIIAAAIRASVERP